MKSILISAWLLIQALVCVTLSILFFVPCLIFGIIWELIIAWNNAIAKKIKHYQNVGV